MRWRTLDGAAPAMRIGLIADTHIPEACDRLPDAVWEAFREVDLVMHAGDVYVNSVIEELARIAPVMVAIGNGDEGSEYHRHHLEPDERIRETHLLEVEGLRVGLAHELPTPDETPEPAFRNAMERHFGGPVDILVQGHSHVEGTRRFGPTLVVNPGSATLPHNLEDRPGTVAILEISTGGRFSVEIIDLARFAIGR
jgi:putative phosphoesterase